MSISTNFKEYQEELELIDMQNPVECDLYSIVAQIIRESLVGKNVSLRDFTERRTSKISEYWKGESGFTDFVIAKRERCVQPKLYGAVEVKYLKVDLGKHMRQIAGHIKTFEKVIYTNGFTWRYYNPNLKWEITLGGMVDNQFKWKDEDNFTELLNKLQEIDWAD